MGRVHAQRRQHDIVSNIQFQPPVLQGDYFTIPSIAITDTEQRVEESKWKALKDSEDNYENIKTALTQPFEHVIDDAYHTGATGMEQRGFGMFTPKQIMEAMMTLYRNPSLPELEAALRRLLELMNWIKRSCYMTSKECKSSCCQIQRRCDNSWISA